MRRRSSLTMSIASCLLRVNPGIHHEMGGVRINVNNEALDADGNVIPGLYAAGEVTGGIHGNKRIGGNAVCDITTFGRNVGERSPILCSRSASFT